MMKMGLLLMLPCLAHTFHASMTTVRSSNGPVQHEVSISLSSAEHANTDNIKPVMKRMRRFAEHMDRMFGDDPLDLDSFFDNPFRHFQAMEKALFAPMGPTPAHPRWRRMRHPDVPSLLRHIDNHKSDPKVAVAAACHNLLPQCMSAGTEFKQLYQCLQLHAKFASCKCAHVLEKTKETLGEPSGDAMVSQDQDGCWHKPTGVWCPKPDGSGWSLKEDKPDPAEQSDPEEEQPDISGEGTPGFLTGDVEAPLGEKDMGGWIARVYTEEQQARMHVDEFGERQKHRISPGKKENKRKRKEREAESRKGKKQDDFEREQNAQEEEVARVMATGVVGRPRSAAEMKAAEEKAARMKASEQEAADQEAGPRTEPEEKLDDRGQPHEVHKSAEETTGDEPSDSDTATTSPQTKLHRLYDHLKKHRAFMPMAILCLALLLAGFVCCCCRSRKNEALDATYTVLLTSEATKLSPGDQL